MSRIALLFFLLAGCRGGNSNQPAMEPRRVEVDPAGIHGLIQIGNDIFSGCEPHGDEAFASLQSMGIRTIVSVDGVAPNVESAKKHGLRYVHIPFGYDAIPEESRLRLVAVARELQFPVYVHCHHGKHRGPAATAILGLACRKIDADGAKKLLELAGTSPDYPGLWRDVQAFQLPDAGVALPGLVEVAEVNSLASAMATLDRRWDHLRLIEKAKGKVPHEHPDLVPQTEALLVKELFREAGRAIDSRQVDLKKRFAEAEKTAAEIETALRNGRTDDLARFMKQLGESCQDCHRQFRNVQR